MFKERLLHFTGFDRFERKYLLFLIPASIAVAAVLLCRCYLENMGRIGYFKFFLSAAARFFVYAIPYGVCMSVIYHTLPVLAVGILQIVLFSIMNFLVAVAWQGLIADIEKTNT